MALPILIYNVRNPDFLFYSLAQAKHLNPDSRVILLGDETNDYYGFVEHFHIENYLGDDAREFASVYKHLSAKSYEMELRCFLRWFAIKDFMTKENVEACFSVDSDVMIYCDITEEHEKFRHVDYTLTRLQSPGIAFINNPEVLSEFCSFVLELYKNPESLGELEDLFFEHRRDTLAFDISDMTAFQRFLKHDHHSVADTFEIIDDSVFDDCLIMPQGYEYANGIKTIHWMGNRPYCKHVETGKLIRFNLLHFAGTDAKPLIRYMCTLRHVG